MKPLESVLKPVMVRIRRETALQILELAHAQGLRTGPFLAHIAETLAQCPPQKFHAAMAQFLHESQRP
ncbi:MAG TPA: hypothetical protein VLW52_00605 [Opitutaceae bacterium]|nr:hypothetical protein [Opitutaceae bacterium]